MAIHQTSFTLQELINCRVVTLVAVKLKRWWLWSLLWD